MLVKFFKSNIYNNIQFTKMVKNSSACDTRCQLLFTEAINTENSSRLNWFRKNQQRLIDNLGSQKLVGKAKAQIAEQEEKRRKRLEAERNKKQQKFTGPPNWRPAIDGALNLDYMRPIEPSVSNLLYEKGMPSYETRKNYLNERYEKMLEDRYYYLYGSSWVYGWRFKDFPPVQATKLGKRQIIQASFYRRNASSLQRDPNWYKICQTGNSKNYNDVLTY
ncbi:protein SPMIP1 [Neodiprion pinetum]|uniref:protein SPMIP1 n=1 Tax=Neodiprion pinetum TaxID=441929 RepID=UPI001EE11AD1|nr:protein ATP6V1FNB-like [Neodiprion pinetum]